MDSAFQELLEEFLLEARERADEVETLLLALPGADMETRQAHLARIKRELHTLKGNAGMMGFSDLQHRAHRMEDEIELLDLAQPDIDALLEGIDITRRRLVAIAGSDGQADADVDDARAADDASSSDSDADRPARSAARTPSPVRDHEKGQNSESAKTPAAVPAPRTGVAATSVRVPFAKIDQLVEMLAETLIFRNRLTDAIERADQHVKRLTSEGAAAVDDVINGWDEVGLGHQILEKTLNQLQEYVTELGMVPLQLLFRSLGRIVHDESNHYGKQVDFHVEGGETPIDKTLLEVAGEALGHLIRNAVIHGVETPEVRRAGGKSATARIAVLASIEGGSVCIRVTDDGGGIDLDALRRKAEAEGEDELLRLTDEHERQRAQTASADVPEARSPHPLYAMIFQAGVSTHSSADLGAGRGVGLAAVKKSVERRGGRIEVRSRRGDGTSFELRLPLTASILRSLLLQVDRETYALPMAAVVETQRFDPAMRHTINHAPVVRWRGQLVLLLDLGVAFATRDSVRTDGYLVVIEYDDRVRALLADDIVGIRDIVVKTLDPIVGQPTGIAGSTILGDGRVIMILEPTSLGITAASASSPHPPSMGTATATGV
ncbi:MAG: chemotaxis protein CheW [Acidobacteriota bacterium]